jgi:predicted membrane protein
MLDDANLDSSVAAHIRALGPQKQSRAPAEYQLLELLGALLLGPPMALLVAELVADNHHHASGSLNESLLSAASKVIVSQNGTLLLANLPPLVTVLENCAASSEVIDYASALGTIMQGVSSARNILYCFDAVHTWNDVATSLLGQYALHSDDRDIPYEFIDGLVCELADAARFVFKIQAAADRLAARFPSVSAVCIADASIPVDPVIVSPIQSSVNVVGGLAADPSLDRLQNILDGMVAAVSALDAGGGPSAFQSYTAPGKGYPRRSSYREYRESGGYGKGGSAPTNEGAPKPSLTVPTTRTRRGSPLPTKLTPHRLANTSLAARILLRSVSLRNSVFRCLAVSKRRWM